MVEMEVEVEDTNLPEAMVRVVWEILPGNDQHFFREISIEDIDPNFFSSDSPVDSSNFPCLPHPLLNPAENCIDQIWTQSVIKINYQPWGCFDELDP